MSEQKSAGAAPTLFAIEGLSFKASACIDECKVDYIIKVCVLLIPHHFSESLTLANFAFLGAISMVQNYLFHELAEMVGNSFGNALGD